MAELRQVIRDLKIHIEKSRLSGREFADAVVAAFEAIDQRFIDIEKRLPPVGALKFEDTRPSAKNAVKDSKS